MDLGDSFLSWKQIQASMGALASFVDTWKEHKSADEEDTQPIYAVIIMKEMNDSHILSCRSKLEIKLKHCPYGENATKCLFVRDLHDPSTGSKFANCKATIQYYQSILQEKGIDDVEVITAVTLCEKYGPSKELRAQLAEQYDVFFVDEKISSFISRPLGNTFKSRKGLPIKLDLESDRLNKITLNYLTRYFYLYFSKATTYYKLPIGNSNTPIDQLNSNMKYVRAALLHRGPGGYKNVKSIMVKGLRTPMVPCYVSYDYICRNLNSNNTPAIQMGEVSTIDDDSVDK